MSSAALIEVEEPTHGCCTRILLIPVAFASLFLAAVFVIIDLLSAPVMFVLLVCCKITICRCCCPENVHHTFMTIILTPCRLLRIVCTGRGHIGCCAKNTWPYLGGAGDGPSRV
eukprot:gene35774-46420_t